MLLWKKVHNPLLKFSVHTKVKQIASVNSPTYYSTTHYLANDSGNSSRLINRRCEWTLMSKTCFCTYYGLKKFQRLSKEDACMLQILLESSNFILIPEHGVTFSYVTILRKHFRGACPFPYPKIPIWKCCRICSGTQGLALSPFPTCCLLVKLIVNLFL